MKLCFVTVALLVALSPVFLVSAQTPPCGEIIVPFNYYGEESEEERKLIDDCSNPFNADTTVSFVAELKIVQSSA